MTPATPAATQARMSSRPATPPEATTGRPASACSAAAPAASTPVNMPSRATSVYSTSVTPDLLDPPRHLGRLEAGALQPAGHLDLAVAGVDAAADLPGEAVAGLADQVEPLHRRGPEHHRRHAELEHLLDVGQRPQAAAQLDLAAP